MSEEGWMRAHLHVYDGHCEPCAVRDAQRDQETIAALRKHIEALERAFVDMAIPTAALLMDKGSHKYIAPEIIDGWRAALAEGGTLLQNGPDHD